MANVLIVDDSSVMRRNLKMLFKDAGHNVVAEAADGKQGYLEYEKHLPDLVTMDISMPIMDGVEAVEKILAEFPEAKIIMISALDQKNMVFNALRAGAKHYIVKPITIKKVTNIVDKVLTT